MVHRPLTRLAAALALVVGLAWPAHAASAIVADRLVDCANDASSNGTTISTSILNNCTQGKAATWTITGTASTLTIQASPGVNREAQTVFRETGSTVAANGTTRIIRYTPTASLSHLDNDIPYTTYWVSRSACITFNAANDGAGGHVFDLLRLDNSAGDWAVLQFNNGADGAGQGYAINLHTNPSGVSTTTGNLTIVQGSSHCFSLRFNSLAHTASLYMYSTDWATQETHITANTNSGCSDGGNNCYINKAYFGNVEAGTTTGSIDFWSIIDDYGTAADPLKAAASWWGPKYCVNSDTSGTSSTAMPTCAVSNVAAGDLGVALLKFENTTTTVSSCSDGTSSWTIWSKNTVDNGGTNGEPHLVVAYKLGMVATGSVTLSCTLTAGKPFRDTVVFILTPPSGTSTLTVDGTPQSGVGSGTAAATASATTTTNAQGSISFVGYSEFGATVQNQQVNSVHMDAFKQATSGGHSAAFVVAYTTGFTGTATGTLSASNRWDLGIINFAAAAAGGAGTCTPAATLGIARCEEANR